MTRYALADESPEYRKQRAELLEAEIALVDQIEAVAELRRGLHRETPCEDYVLRANLAALDRDGAPSEIRLSELFDAAGKPLVLMHFMDHQVLRGPWRFTGRFWPGWLVRTLRWNGPWLFWLFLIVAQAVCLTIGEPSNEFIYFQF